MVCAVALAADATMTTRDAKTAVRFMIASFGWAAIISHVPLLTYDCDHMPMPIRPMHFDPTGEKRAISPP